MSTLATNARKIKIPSHERTFTLFQAIAVIVISALVFAGSGYVVGKKFFWKSVNDTRIEQQLAFYKAKVESNPRVPEDRVNLGYTYYLKGQNEEALQQFKVAITLDPKFADAYYDMGVVYKDQKKYDDALEAFSKGAKLAPRDYKNFLQMGVIYNLQGKYKDAITALNRANSERPGSSDVIYQIGISAEKTGDIDGARQLYQQAVNFDPNYKEAKEALARVSSK